MGILCDNRHLRFAAVMGFRGLVLYFHYHPQPCVSLRPFEKLTALGSKAVLMRPASGTGTQAVAHFHALSNPASGCHKAVHFHS